MLRRFDLVLPFVMPDSSAIRQTLERRLIGYSLARMGWKRVTDAAAGLSTADVVAAAEDAARRAVLSDTNKIATRDLLDAIERRRSLQELGTRDIVTSPSTLSASQSWSTAPVLGNRRTP